MVTKSDAQGISMAEINGKIRLELTEKITFPERCIYCGCQNPDGTVPLSPREDESAASGRMILFAVPACTACAYSHAAREKHISMVACAFFLLLMTVAGSLILGNYYSLIFVALGLLLVALVYSVDALKVAKPLISIESINDSSITFHSPNREYFEIFREINQALIDLKSETGV